MRDAAGSLLSTVGTAAMVWVGGHILIAGADELGWHGPYDLVHSLESPVQGIAGVGGVLAWLVNTSASAVVGLIVGFAVLAVVSRFPRGKPGAASAASRSWLNIVRRG